MIYLASPYSHPDPAVRQWRFEAACMTAAWILRDGDMVFSPIAHTHPVAQFGLPKGWEFWQAYDREFLEWCTEMRILELPGWSTSIGVQAEITFAAGRSMPMRTIQPSDVGIIPALFDAEGG